MALWYTDRSRYEVGTGQCARQRFLEYHSGPSGYGIRRKAESLPLARGIFLHEGLAVLFRDAQAHDAPPSEATIREAATVACAAYRTSTETRGLALLADEQALAEVIAEQESLLIGTIWTVGLDWLPWLLSEYRIVDVEQEDVAVLDCTCGLGDLVGTGPDHEARGCEGIGWQCRPDLITQRRTTQSYQYWEMKSASQTGERWDTQWETKIQFSAGVLGAEARLGVAIDETWVLGIVVGSRWSKEGPPRQNSPYCYGYKQPGQPPFGEDRWEWKYDDPDRVPQRLNRSFVKSPVWSTTFTGQPEGMASAEYWVRWLSPAARQGQLAIVGPLNRQGVLLQKFKAQLVAEERKWQQGLWEAYEALVAHDCDPQAPGYQATLDRLFPCSWQCRRYGKRYQCAYVPICFEHEAAKDPLGSGAFVLRAPHHTPEKIQMQERGVAVPDEMSQDQDEGGDDE